MKLIGIIGKSGSGKTTFANMLKRDEKTAIINLDQVTVNFKSKIGKSKIKSYTNQMGEKRIAYTQRATKLLGILKNNKLIDGLYIKMLRIPQNKGIIKQIEDLKRKGFETVIVERKYTCSFTII